MKKKYRPATSDFKYSSLPHNRKEMFFDCYRNQFGVICKSGLTLLLFALPLIAFMITMDFIYLSIMKSFTGDELTNTIMLWDIVFNGGVIVLLFVLLIGLSGIMRVIRQLIWSEGVDFWHDFKLGVKENYGQFALISIIFAILYALAYFMFIMFSYSLVGLTPLIIFIVFFLAIYFWYLLMVNVYDSKFSQYFKNGLFFFAKTFGWSLLLTLGSILPFFINLIPFYSNSIKYLIWILMCIFYLPSLIMIWELYSFSKFDQYLNQENYPELYRKGLFEQK